MIRSILILTALLSLTLQAAPVLRQLSVRPLPEPVDLQALGLSGRNKPDGLYRRYRVSLPEKIPDFIPRKTEEERLTILDRSGERWVALYRTPPGGGEEYSTVTVYDAKGEGLYRMSPGYLFSQRRGLEVQDMHLEGDILYFNGACVGPSSHYRGRCSALYAYDFPHEDLLWKSPDRVSRGIFLPGDDAIISGYGATGERDWLYLLDKRNGQILQRLPLDTAPFYMERKGNRLFVVTHRKLYTFALEEKAAKRGEPPDSVEAIRREYRAIRRALSGMRKETVSLQGQSTEGGERTLYRDDSGKVRMVRDEVMGETGKWLREAYFAGGKPFFVYEATTRYDAPIYAENFHPERSTTTENRYYLPGGRLSRWLRGKQPVDPHSHKFAAKAKSLRERLTEISADKSP
jgi:hypothetical protein